MPLSPASLYLPVSANHRILVAVSGGLDSVVLLHLLHLRGAKTGVAHCNFGLRGAESDGDEKFVQDLTARYKFPFYSTHFRTLQHAGSQGISTQMAARELRYNWFEEIRREQNYDFIATAHHLNDSVETVLLNLVRGTGPAGLSGISGKSGNIIRPLISVTREEIESYAREQGLSWRDDSSNSSDLYKRNFLRHNVIPLLQELNPNLLQTVQQTMQRMADATEIIREKAAEVKNSAATDTNNQVWIKTGLLPEKGLPLLLHELIKPYNFTYLQACEISRNLAGQAGKQFLSPTHRLLIDRQQLIITALDEIASQTISEIEIDKDVHDVSFADSELKLKTIPAAGYTLSPAPEVAALDADKLYFPLILRKWQPGDKFLPFGMRGQKKVSDFLIDQKTPLYNKANTWVLVSGNDIVWLVGLRINEKYRITKETKMVLEVRLLKK